MRDRLLVGRCLFEPKPYTRIYPIAAVERSLWRGKTDWTHELPPDGHAFSPRHPGVSGGELLLFGTTENERLEPGKDVFLAEPIGRATVVLDFRGVTVETARRSVVERGLETIPIGGMSGVVIALGKRSCISVKLVEDPSTGRFIAEPHELDHLAVHMFDESLFDGDRVDGAWIAVPGVSIGPQIGTLDWSTDSQFLDVVLKRLRRTIPGLNGSSTLTRAQVAAVVSDLTRASLLPSQSEDLAPMVARLHTFAQDLNQNVSHVDELVEIVESLRPVHDRVSAHLAQTRSQLEQAIRSEIEEHVRSTLGPELSAKVRQSEDLATQIANAKAEIERTQQLNDMLRSELSATITDLGVKLDEDAGVTSRELFKKLEQALERRIADTSSEIDILPRPSPPWTRWRRTHRPASNWNEAAELLEKAAAGSGYLGEEFLAADLAIRSGSIVVLPYDTASDFVSAFARVMAGGRWIRQTVDPATLAIDDLWSRPGSGEVSGLAKGWTEAARDKESYSIILLDGLHRSATQLWLPSFVDEMESSRWPRNLLVFASLGEDVLDEARQWKGLASTATGISPTVTIAEPRALRLALGSVDKLTALNPEAAPRPDEERLIALSEISGTSDRPANRRYLRGLVATWGLRDRYDSSVVQRWAYRSGDGDGPLDRAFAAGRDWLAGRWGTTK